MAPAKDSSNVKVTAPDGTVFELNPNDPGSQKFLSMIVNAAYSRETVETDDTDEKHSEDKLLVENVEDLMASSLKDRVASLIRNSFFDWFTSQDLCGLYESAFGERLKQSTASTYLSRLHETGLLRRKGSLAQRMYAATSELCQRYSELDVHSMADVAELYQP